VTKRLQLRSCSFHKNVAQCLISLPPKFDDKIRRGTLELGAQSRVGWILTSRSRKLCEIELRWQIITNRKSYMGFRLQQKSMTLNANSLLCRQFMRIVTKRLMLESRCFHYKVAPHLGYLHIKFDDDRGSLDVGA